MEYMIAAHMRKSQARPMSMPRRATHQPDVSPVVGRCAHGWLHPGELDLAAQQGQARSVSSRAGGALSTLPRKWAASRRRKKSTRNLLGGRWQGPVQQLDGRCKAMRGWLDMVRNPPQQTPFQFLALPTPQLSPSFFPPQRHFNPPLLAEMSAGWACTSTGDVTHHAQPGVHLAERPCPDSGW